MYKVIQWATGRVGADALRQIIDRPDLELVGVYTHSQDKVGRDAGSLCGRPDTGIFATRDIEAILALDADCVIHMPRLGPNSDESDAEVEALLRSGKSVISTRGYVYPRWLGAAYELRFADACKAGNATLMGSGLNPGFVFSRVGVTLTGMSSTIQEIRFYEGFNLSTWPYQMMTEVCGLGQPIDDVNERPLAAAVDALFREELHEVASALRLQALSVEKETLRWPAPEDLVFETGTIPKGGTAAIEFYWTMQCTNDVVLKTTLRWFVHNFAGVDIRNVWKIDIRGEPNVLAELQTPDYTQEAAHETRSNTSAISAPPVNAIPGVCAAPPGIFRVPVFGAWFPRGSSAD